MWDPIINSIGLGLDIVGVIMLFLYGLPKEINRCGYVVLSFGEDENEAKKWNRYNRLSWAALGLIVLGFLLQIVSNFTHELLGLLLNMLTLAELRIGRI